MNKPIISYDIFKRYFIKHLNQEHSWIVFLHQMKVYVFNGFCILRVIHPLVWAARLMSISLLGNLHCYAMYITLN